MRRARFDCLGNEGKIAGGGEFGNGEMEIQMMPKTHRQRKEVDSAVRSRKVVSSAFVCGHQRVVCSVFVNGRKAQREKRKIHNFIRKT